MHTYFEFRPPLLFYISKLFSHILFFAVQVLSETSNLNLLFIVDSYIKIISTDLTTKTNPLAISLPKAPVSGAEAGSPKFGNGTTTPRGRTQFLLGGHR